MPTPIRRKPRRRSVARWGGLASHIPTSAAAEPSVPTPQAIVSPSVRARTPKRRSRLYQLAWVKAPLRAIAREWARAACWSLTPICSGGAPCAARAWLIACSRFCSCVLSSRSSDNSDDDAFDESDSATTTNDRTASVRPPRTTKRAFLADGSADCAFYPEECVFKHLRLSRGLRKNDCCEHYEGAEQLESGQRLTQPRVRENRCSHRLEHRRDRGP